MTTCDDPEERKTVLDIVRPVVKERVYPVGRLDYHSEGLLILTNDGDLAARITHPRFGVVREYLVKLRGDLTNSEYRKLMAGTTVEGRHVRPKKAQRSSKGRGGKATWWMVEVMEGRTHEVRELFLHAGHHVQRLRRSAIGPLRDDSLKPGDFRTISERELEGLRRASWKSSQRHVSRNERRKTRVPEKGRETSAKPAKKNR
jgi:23S rRNA pseudouridine2605 synthase